MQSRPKTCPVGATSPPSSGTEPGEPAHHRPSQSRACDASRESAKGSYWTAEVNRCTVVVVRRGGKGMSMHTALRDLPYRETSRVSASIPTEVCGDVHALPRRGLGRGRRATPFGHKRHLNGSRGAARSASSPP